MRGRGSTLVTDADETPYEIETEALDVEEEARAWTPQPLDPRGFNSDASLPYGLTTDHLRPAMQEFLEFLGFVNAELHTRRIARLETLMMPAGFSSLVGEFMVGSIPTYCSGLVKNRYHSGHPDLLPANRFPANSI